MQKNALFGAFIRAVRPRAQCISNSGSWPFNQRDDCQFLRKGYTPIVFHLLSYDFSLKYCCGVAYYCFLKGGKKAQDKHGVGQDVTTRDLKNAAHQEKAHLLAPSDDEGEDGAGAGGSEEGSSFHTVGLDLESSAQPSQPSRRNQETNLLDMAEDDGESYHELPDPGVSRQDSSYRQV